MASSPFPPKLVGKKSLLILEEKQAFPEIWLCDTIDSPSHLIITLPSATQRGYVVPNDKKLKDRELSVEIWVDAPSSLCWEVLSHQMEDWWCPKPWRVTLEDVDLRSGGRCLMKLHGPNGETHVSDTLFVEVVEGHKIITTDSMTRDEDGEIWPHTPFMMGGWELTPENGGTLYRAWARHWSMESRDDHETMGFRQGWLAIAEQFKQICEARARNAPIPALP